MQVPRSKQPAPLCPPHGALAAGEPSGPGRLGGRGRGAAGRAEDAVLRAGHPSASLESGCLEGRRKAPAGGMRRDAPPARDCLSPTGTPGGGRALGALPPGTQWDGGTESHGELELSARGSVRIKHGRESQGVGCAPGWSARGGRSRSKWSPGSHRRDGLGVEPFVPVPRCLTAAPSIRSPRHSSFPPCPDPRAEEQGNNTPAPVFSPCTLALG